MYDFASPFGWRWLERFPFKTSTRAKVNGKGEGMYLADIKEVQRAYDNGEVAL